MTWQAWFTLAVVGLIFAGLFRRIGPPDVLMLSGTILVALVGIISPQEAFLGLSNEGMLTVAALFVVAAGLRETGVLDLIGHHVMGRARKERGAILRLVPPVLGMSAFLNNTPVVAMLIPIVSDWCRKNRISPSRIMIPISYLAILGGTCTLIGTSTNLVVNGMMIQSGMKGMSLFELGYLGLPYALIGVIYLLVIGRRLLPNRKDLLEQLGDSRREYLVDMMVQPGCRLINQRVDQAGLRRLPGLFLIEINRGEQIITPVRPDERLCENDRLTFTGVVSTIVDLERIPGLVPVVDDKYIAADSERREQRLCEAVISPTSPVLYKSIRDANFRALYNAAVIAVHRGGARLQGRIGDIVLWPGDTLLLQTDPHFATAHRNNTDFFLVGGVEGARPVRHDRAWLALGLLAVLIVLMTLSTGGIGGIGGIPIALSAFLIAGLMIGTRCLSAADARQSIDLQVLVTIAAAFGMARALDNSGAADYVAQKVLLIDTSHALGLYLALAVVYLVTSLLTEMITNNAAAILVFPFALALANKIGVDPRPFAIAVTFAASASFATPIGYQTNMMVYGLGGYRFSDFVRVGLPLNLLLAVVAVLLIPLIWPF
ncbi:MAG: SLC13 family permease [Phycisphaerales bacterium]|nr:SLC13 family permease [Phycisphaerales bacterium]